MFKSVGAFRDFFYIYVSFYIRVKKAESIKDINNTHILPNMTDSKTTATCWHKVFPGKPMRFMHLCNSCEGVIGLSLFVALPGTGISGLCTTCASGRSDLIEINLGADCDCMNDETATKETRPHNNSLVDVAK